MCEGLWRPAVRFCAVVALGGEGRRASCTHPALATSCDDSEFHRLLDKLVRSAQLQRHSDLTVLTELGMMHYNLLPTQGLLFMAVTIKEMAQPDAFTFLRNLRDRVFREFPQAAAPAGSPSQFEVPRGERRCCCECVHGASSHGRL